MSTPARRADATLVSVFSERQAMKVNEGVLDRSLRVAVGAVLIGLSIAEVIGPWGYIGVVPLVTGAVGMCPLYSLLGISSAPARGA
jgi:hypothetical protein